MRIHRSLAQLPPRARGAVVAIGNFDGVHHGHRAVLREAAALATRAGAPLGVLTFEPHPREVLTPERAPPRLTPFRTKALLLRLRDLDHLYVLRFDRALAALSPEDFARRVLAQGLGVRHGVVGDDFRFGHRRAGDVALLEALGREAGFEVSALAPVAFEGEVCSSSRIREAIAMGEVARAARLLGHPHHVAGLVVRGDGRGRGLGYPTANLRLLAPRLLLPPDGVYAVRAALVQPGGGLAWADAAASLGTNPTFAGTERRLEVHLLDQQRDLYGRRLCVAFVERLRAQETFASAEALVAQMGRDCARARSLLGAAEAPPTLPLP
jgi:riboflavin kinase / FMN adenylyltransferase